MLLFFVFIIFSVACLAFSYLLYRSQKMFEENCEYTTGSVIGYRVMDHSSYNTPRVKFWYNGEEIITGAQAVRGKNRPNVGTKVRIAYMKKNYAGHDTWRVRIVNKHKNGVSSYIASNILLLISLIFCGIAFSLLLMY